MESFTPKQLNHIMRVLLAEFPDFRNKEGGGLIRCIKLFRDITASELFTSKKTYDQELEKINA